MALDAALAKSLFLNASELPDSAARAEYLDKACGDNAELRARVEALLRVNDESPLPPQSTRDATVASDGRGLDFEAGGETLPNSDHLASTAELRSKLESGVVISNRYTLQERIGEGGMGEVWVAKQTEPVKRKVALKLIKTGMDSRAVLQRFEQERQALAMMDHPNIAKVLDAGLTPTGQPFFVMELVNGLPLNKFCDELRLSTRERLDLFVPICQAVQHAHQKGIVHRDLKPANILLTMIDGKPVPKVIDFGVAKATSGKLTEETMSTAFGSVVGTLEYMSPEQTGFSGEDVDTRADVYSLGVILYELLTGLRPIDAARLRKAALTEMVRIIQEEEPSKPSTRLSTDAGMASLAALRQTEPKKLAALLRGELDWVVMKCLEKQRDRRYDTANALVRDVQRYLADEVVEARPPSPGYRFKKVVHRHKGQVIAASLVLFALLAGMAGTTWGLIEAKKQEREAKKQEQIAQDETFAKEQARAAEAERAEGERLARLDAQANEKLAGERLIQVEAEKKKAEEEKQIARSVKDFLQNKLLAQTDTTVQADALLQSGRAASEAKLNPTIRELLDRAAKELAPEKIEQSFAKQPLIQAEILATVGETYRDVGEYLPAINFLKRSEALYRQHLGPEHPQTLESMNDLALAYQHAAKFAPALALFEETLKLRKAKLGPEHPDTLESMNNLAGTYGVAGKLAPALVLYQETLRLRKAKLGPDHPRTLESMNNLAFTYEAAGKLDPAQSLYEETLKLSKAKLGSEHPQTLNSMNNLAGAYFRAGKLDLALPLCEDALKLARAKLGPEHPQTLTSIGNLAAVYHQTAGKLDLALPLFEETVKLSKAKLGLEHPDTLNRLGNLATAYQDAGKPDLALPLCEETLKLSKAKLGPEHPQTLSVMKNLAGAYLAVGKLDLALPLYEETLKLRKAKLGPEHPDTLTSINDLAVAYYAAGERDLALPLFEETLKLTRAKLGPDHPETLTVMSNLAGAYQAVGKLDLALPLLEETFKLSKAKLGPEHPQTLTVMNSLALAYRAVGKPDLALALCEETLKLRKAKLGPEHPQTLESMNNLALAYQDAAKLDLALPLYVETLKLTRAKLGPEHPQTLSSMGNLATVYLAVGKLDLALPLCEETVKLSKDKLGPEHPETLNSINNLASLYQAAGKLDLALPLYEETLKLTRAKLGPEHPQTLTGMGNLGVVYCKLNQGEKAAATLKEFVAGMRKRSKPDDPQFARLLSEVSLDLLKCGQHDVTEEFLRECLAIREKTQPDAWSTFNTKSTLGGALSGQKKYAEAEPLLLAGYKGMKQREKTIPEQGKVRLPEAIERLVQLYEATDKKDEVAKWRKELDAIKVAEKASSEEAMTEARR